MEVKQERQRALLNILRNRKLTSQQGVVRAMHSAGFPVTQPSISRDFQELGVVKLGGRYVAASEMQEASKELTTPSVKALSVNAAGPNMVVVKTPAGAATLLALKLDSHEIPGVVGTIAGDDTVFVAVSNKGTQARIERIVAEFSH